VNLRIQPPKPFEGNAKDLKRFERAFRTYAQLSMADDETIRTALGSYLEGQAARWYEQVTDKADNSLDQLFQKMRDQFCPIQKVHSLRRELWSMKMTPGEDIEEYIKRFEDQCEVLELDNLNKTEAFMKGCRSDIRRHLNIHQPPEIMAAYNQA
jgi:hypothetical protein